MRRVRGGLFVLLGVSWAAAVSAQGADRSILTLDRVLGGEFATESFGPARWREKGAAYTTLERAEDGKGRELVRYETATGRREVLVSADKLVPEGAEDPLGIEDYAWSDDGTKLLIFTNSRRVWRLHTRGDYWVLDLKGGGLRKLGGDAPEASLMFAKFAPDGRRVAYVRANDIYVEDSDGRITRLTSDGSPSRSNGTFDWVYEEEFSLRDGFRSSPDGKSIAYWQVDDEGVKDYILINTTEDTYPKLTRIPYPKVGQVNPSCRVGVVSADGGATRWMEVPGDPRNHYNARMDWAANSDELVLQHLNRLQNTDEVMLADVHTGKVRAVLTEQDDAWVDVTDDLHWLDGGRRFTWPSERDGWRRLYVAPRDGERAPRAITPPSDDVIDVLRVDEREGVVDYIAAPDDPTRRYLFRAPLDGSASPRRLTPPDRPGTHAYQIAPDGHWAFHRYSTFDRPPVVELVSLPDHKVVRTLADNAKALEHLSALKACPTEFFRVDIGAGVVLDGWCIKPPGFDPSKKYPVLVHVYGEPALQTVLDQWGGHIGLWHRMLAQRGYVVLSVDNRGTPAPRGRAWRKSVYRQIGTLASRDQADALKALGARWPWIDRERVGVWGWSGGGSMSLNAIFRYPDLYRTAVAVAAVPDQRLYDTIYQERYMGLPADNPDGYREGSPITHAGNLRGHLLVIHGTGDDNCHFQGCERLIDALVAAGKPFSMMAYPNRTHSISEGPGTTRHLFALMTRDLEQNLPPGPRE